MNILDSLKQEDSKKIENLSFKSNKIDISISILKQRIVKIINQSREEEGIEILSRLDGISPDVFFLNTSEELKIDFDFYILEKVLNLYNQGLIKYNNIHINLNPITLLDLDFKNKISGIISQFSFKDFSKISFEILENGNIQDNVELLNFNIWYLRYLGFKVGLDDYPNENNTNELLLLIEKLDFVKIDKHFLLSLKKYQTAEEIIVMIQKCIDDIKSIHQNVDIILEGVENEDMLNKICNHLTGINSLQGYYFGRPEELL